MAARKVSDRKIDKNAAYNRAVDDAERSALGCSMMDGTAADVAIAILKPDDFRSTELRVLFEIIREERHQGNPVDQVLLHDKLLKNDVYEGVDVALFMESILATVPHSAHVAHYCQRVKEFSQERQAKHQAKDLLDRLEKRDGELKEILHESIEKFQDIAYESFENIPEDAKSLIGAAVIHHKIRTIETRFPAIDAFGGGIPMSGLTVLAARPSNGKTALGLSIARRMAIDGTGVFIASYEMPKIELEQRLLSISTGVSLTKIMRHDLSGNEFEQLAELQDAEWLSRIIIDDEVRPLDDLVSTVRYYAGQGIIKVLIVDYLQLIPARNTKVTREQQVSDISRSLKRIAKRFDIAVLSLAQLNREADKRNTAKPRLSDIRESGSVENDADLIWLLWREHRETAFQDTTAEVIIAKARNGSIGAAQLSWDGPTTTFSDSVPQQAEWNN